MKVFLKILKIKKRVNMDKLLQNIKQVASSGATTIYINRNTQLSLMFMRAELLSMDIEPDFSEREYAGIPIEVDNTLDDYDVRF